MTNEILRQYPLEPIVRREFLKRASLATLVWGASPRTAWAQAGTPGQSGQGSPFEEFPAHNRFQWILTKKFIRQGDPPLKM